MANSRDQIMLQAIIRAVYMSRSIRAQDVSVILNHIKFCNDIGILFPLPEKFDFGGGLEYSPDSMEINLIYNELASSIGPMTSERKESAEEGSHESKSAHRKSVIADSYEAPTPTPVPSSPKIGSSGPRRQNFKGLAAAAAAPASPSVDERPSPAAPPAASVPAAPGSGIKRKAPDTDEATTKSPAIATKDTDPKPGPRGPRGPRGP